MKKRHILQLLDLYETGETSTFTAAEWHALRPLIEATYTDKPAPFPVEFRSHEHRLQILTLRAAAGVRLHHPRDVSPPAESLPNAPAIHDHESQSDDGEGGEGKPIPHSRTRPRILAGAFELCRV